MKKNLIILGCLSLFWSLSSSAADCWETVSGGEVATIIYDARNEMASAILDANNQVMPALTFSKILKSTKGILTTYKLEGQYAAVGCNPPGEYFELLVYKTINPGHMSSSSWSAEFKTLSSIPVPA